MSAILGELGSAGIEAEDLAVRRPTLDEVFMKLTGHPAEQPTNDDTNGDDGSQEEAA